MADVERNLLGERFTEAFAYAARLHAAQRRKAKETPYLAHLMAVSSMVLECGGDEDEAMAALLHDAAEDQGGQAVLDVIAAHEADQATPPPLEQQWEGKGRA